MHIRGVSFLILSSSSAEKKIRSLAPSSFDDTVKVETGPPAQEPVPKPAITSGQKSSAAIALKPPQVSEDGGDESDVHKCVFPFPDSFKFVG